MKHNSVTKWMTALAVMGMLMTLGACGSGGAEGDPCLNGSMICDVFPLLPDTDKDDIVDVHDNCPNLANTDQADADKDDIGDACDKFKEIFQTDALVGSTQAIVKDWLPTPKPVDGSSKCFEDGMTANDNIGPVSLPIKDTDFTGKIIYVDAQVTAEGDGSKVSPLKTISKALLTAERTPGTILVAGGTYNEDLEIGSGNLLYGGFTAGSWVRDLATSPSIIQDQNSSLLVIKTGEEKTVIDGFTIYGAGDGAVEADTGVKLVLNNNTMYINLEPNNDKANKHDTHFGRALGSDALLHAYNNRVLVPSETPEKIISTGFVLSGACNVISGNHFVSLRTSIYSYFSDKGLIVNNVIEAGLNGMTMSEASFVIDNNTIALKASGLGCGYAIYMAKNSPTGVELPSNPSIDNNVIILDGYGTNGINEAYHAADPASLTGNHYVVVGSPEQKNGLYYDYDQGHNGMTSIDSINNMKGIPKVGSNTVEYTKGSNKGVKY